jgi:hypothetical protein
MGLLEKDALGSHIHGKQFKKVTEDGVFGKGRKGQMGLGFFIWRMKVLFDLEIGNRLSCEVFFVFFFLQTYMYQLIINTSLFYIYIYQILFFFFYQRQTFSLL